MSIDYDKVEGFKALDQKEGKAALATYAMETFQVKLNKQKSLDNMLADLEQATFKAMPDLSDLEKVGDGTEDSVIPWTPPAGYDVGKILGADPETIFKLDLITADSVAAEQNEDGKVIERDPDMDGMASWRPAPDVPVEPPVSDSKPVSGNPAWLDGFAPSIYLMGRSASNNGYYTCPWWIYDWISQTPGWYDKPDECPHASAVSTVKSLAYYLYIDGYVTVRETRNSRFIKLEK